MQDPSPVALPFEGLRCDDEFEILLQVLPPLVPGLQVRPGILVLPSNPLRLRAHQALTYLKWARDGKLWKQTEPWRQFQNNARRVRSVGFTDLPIAKELAQLFDDILRDCGPAPGTVLFPNLDSIKWHGATLFDTDTLTGLVNPSVKTICVTSLDLPGGDHGALIRRQADASRSGPPAFGSEHLAEQTGCQLFTGRTVRMLQSFYDHFNLVAAGPPSFELELACEVEAGTLSQFITAPGVRALSANLRPSIASSVVGGSSDASIRSPTDEWRLVQQGGDPAPPDDANPGSTQELSLEALKLTVNLSEISGLGVRDPDASHPLLQRLLTDMQDFFRHIVHAPLHTLALNFADTSSRPGEYRQRPLWPLSELLRPLLSAELPLQKCTLKATGPSAPSLSDTDVRNIVKSWPGLRELDLRECLSAKSPTPYGARFTVSSLVRIADGLKRVRKLSLPVDILGEIPAEL